MIFFRKLRVRLTPVKLIKNRVAEAGSTCLNLTETHACARSHPKICGCKS